MSSYLCPIWYPCMVCLSGLLFAFLFSCVYTVSCLVSFASLVSCVSQVSFALFCSLYGLLCLLSLLYAYHVSYACLPSPLCLSGLVVVSYAYSLMCLLTWFPCLSGLLCFVSGLLCAYLVSCVSLWSFMSFQSPVLVSCMFPSISCLSVSLVFCGLLCMSDTHGGPVSIVFLVPYANLVYPVSCA